MSRQPAEPPETAPEEPIRPNGRAAVDRLMTAARGLAATIAATEELTQRRADLLTARSTVLGPLGRGQPTNGRPPLISLAEAARRTGRHPEVLRRWCTDGRIPAVRVGRTWGVTHETIATLNAHSGRSRPRFPNPADS